MVSHGGEVVPCHLSQSVMGRLEPSHAGYQATGFRYQDLHGIVPLPRRPTLPRVPKPSRTGPKECSPEVCMPATKSLVKQFPSPPGDRRQVTIHDRPRPLDHVESQQLFRAEEPQLLRLLAAPQGVVEGFFNVRSPADQAPPSAIAAALQEKRAITFEQGEHADTDRPVPPGSVRALVEKLRFGGFRYGVSGYRRTAGRSRPKS